MSGYYFSISGAVSPEPVRWDEIPDNAEMILPEELSSEEPPPWRVFRPAAPSQTVTVDRVSQMRADQRSRARGLKLSGTALMPFMVLTFVDHEMAAIIGAVCGIAGLLVFIAGRLWEG